MVGQGPILLISHCRPSQDAGLTEASLAGRRQRTESRLEVMRLPPGHPRCARSRGVGSDSRQNRSGRTRCDPPRMFRLVADADASEAIEGFCTGSHRVHEAVAAVKGHAGDSGFGRSTRHAELRHGQAQTIADLLRGHRRMYDRPDNITNLESNSFCVRGRDIHNQLLKSSVTIVFLFQIYNITGVER